VLKVALYPDRARAKAERAVAVGAVDEQC